MKICVFSRTFSPAVGGLERMAEILAVEFARAGHAVEVVTDTCGPPSDAPFKIKRTSTILGRIAALRGADVCLSMNLTLHGCLAAYMAGVPLVVSHQSDYPQRGFRGSVLETAKRLLMKRTRNIACSGYLKRQLRIEAVVIPNALDGRYFSVTTDRLPGNGFVYCGRLVSDKGVDVCLRAFQIATRELAGLTLTIIGDGPERSSLERLTEKLGLRGSVRFTGALTGDALTAALRQHACLIVPSLWEEPFGMVALEGLASCDTVVVARRGGLPEVVGTLGVAVEPTEDALGRAILEVARAAQEGKPLPGAAPPEVKRAHLDRFAAGRVARRYLDEIAKVVKA